MALRFYFLPKTGTGTRADPFRPSYIDGLSCSGMAWFGSEPWVLALVDVTPQQHDDIVVNADATAVPQNLDNLIGGNLATVVAKLEAMNIPANWVTAGMSYRVAVRLIVRFFQLLQWFRSFDLLADRFFASGLTLDNTIGDLPVAVRQRLTLAATRRGLDTSSITLATTIRSAFVTICQQIPGRPKIGLVEL